LVAEIYYQATSPPPTVSGNTRVQTPRRNDPLGDVAAKYVDGAKHLRKSTVEAIEKQIMIHGMIEKLDGREKEVIEKRYIEGLEWTDIAAAFGRSKSCVYRIHGNALVAMAGEKKD
jgi:DNA-directed RNA polymerase specialized sigma subunit